MEVHGRQPSEPHPATERFRQNQRALFIANRSRLRAAREKLVEHQKSQRDVRESVDVIDVRTDRHFQPESDEVRTERVAQLERAHREGRLNTPERIEKAAQRLLEG